MTCVIVELNLFEKFKITLRLKSWKIVLWLDRKMRDDRVSRRLLLLVNLRFIQQSGLAFT